MEIAAEDADKIRLIRIGGSRMPNPEKDTPTVRNQVESTAGENVITDHIPEKTRRTVPTVYPDLEYINRTLP
ncbi:MAG: hypothetical protein K0Q77_794 [Anaerosporomusa subterranea]|jgi:hypothetical protein|nr:hypothetical protein [Anaerosporomusa subterranea]